MINLPIVEGRSCDGCTKCCEGNLSSEINGRKVDKNNPCYLVDIGRGCNDYENRPDLPCKVFQCEWLVNELIPEDLKPSKSNTIILKRYTDKNTYLELIEAGEKLNSEVLTWGIQYSLSDDEDANILWNIENKKYWLGNDSFCNFIENQETPQDSSSSFFPTPYIEGQSPKLNISETNDIFTKTKYDPYLSINNENSSQRA